MIVVFDLHLNEQVLIQTEEVEILFDADSNHVANRKQETVQGTVDSDFMHGLGGFEEIGRVELLGENLVNLGDDFKARLRGTSHDIVQAEFVQDLA